MALIATTETQYCRADESEWALEWFTSAGYDATMHLMEGANHFAPLFQDKVDGEWILVPDAPAGRETVQIILDAGEPES